MKRHSKTYLATLLGLALLLTLGTISLMAQEQEAETDYTEEEYNAYDAAAKEPDFLKRGDMLLAFIEKYPKSTLMPYITSEYNKLLREVAEAKKYEQLEPLAEKWLKLHPSDVSTLAYVALATQNLGKMERCVECMEEIYEKQPQPGLAKDIYQGYIKINNLAKQVEWADKLFKMSEFDAEYRLRYDFVLKYTDSKNWPKAAEYAQLTLKSADMVKDPGPKVSEELSMIRKACYHVIGMNQMEQDKWEQAIRSFTLALKAQRYDLGYFLIGQCLENQKKVEEAQVAYAKAELQKGEVAAQAKDRLELLYKALHNGTTIGIDKKYKQAKEELAAEETSNAKLN